LNAIVVVVVSDLINVIIIVVVVVKHDKCCDLFFKIDSIGNICVYVCIYIVLIK